MVRERALNSFAPGPLEETSERPHLRDALHPFGRTRTKARTARQVLLVCVSSPAFAPAQDADFISTVWITKKQAPRGTCFFVIDATGFEPAASASRTQRSTKLSHASIAE